MQGGEPVNEGGCLPVSEGDSWLAEMDSAAVKCNNVMAIFSQDRKHTHTQGHTQDTFHVCTALWPQYYQVLPRRSFTTLYLPHPSILLVCGLSCNLTRFDLAEKHIDSMLVANRLRALGFWALHFISAAFLSHI